MRAPPVPRVHGPGHPAWLQQEVPLGETRFIRIRKFSHRPSTTDMILQTCSLDVAQFCKHRARNVSGAGFHYEIWIYSLTHGFRCFEILMDGIREIPKLSLIPSASSGSGGAA